MSDFVDPGRQYRRGVILGLSLAELFTILVFLLLLVLGAYALMQEETLQDRTAQLEREKALVQDQRDALIAMGARERNPIEPELPDDLQGAQAASDSLHNLGDGLVADEPQNELSPEEAAEKIEQQERAIDGVTRKLAMLEREKEIFREKSDEPDKGTEVLEEEIRRLRNENAALKKNVGNLEEDVHTLSDDLAELKQPGQDSPCWFTPAQRLNGKPYEKAVYIFHVRITDHHLFVRDIAAPSDKYRKQKPTLPFDREALNRRLGDAEFVDAFLPLKEAGEDRRVREDRRCTFYVAVWDATSETNKPRYKSAHNDIVQAVFNTYEFRTDPWPHG